MMKKRKTPPRSMRLLANELMDGLGDVEEL
jgi:hypothetical protein